MAEALESPKSSAADAFWTDQTSVLFTSFWGWTPETWGCVGWSNVRGRSRRDNLLRVLTDPFITVIYVTDNGDRRVDPTLKGRIAGFYLVSHETGDRDEFTDVVQHSVSPEKWRHSVRAIRAFEYLPEWRLSVAELDPALKGRARSVASMARLLTDSAQIRRLRETPWYEVPVYKSASDRAAAVPEADFAVPGFVKAGPANRAGYVVSTAAWSLPRQLYVLRLEGDTSAYLGEPAGDRSIYKIGIAASPELRRQFFQEAMPQGAFRWRIECTSGLSGERPCSYPVALVGEDAMKRYLHKYATHLGGEFYAASSSQLEEAWQQGCAEAKAASVSQETV